MDSLDRYSALTDAHFAIRDAVEDLEFTWGIPPRVRSIAERVGMAEAVVAAHLYDLARVKVLDFDSASMVASGYSGLPVLGVVE